MGGLPSPQNYKGTRDWLAQDACVRQFVISTLTSVFELFGFEPLETPVVELKRTLQGKYGEEGDNLTYYFSKGMDDIGLRYDHTVPLARVVAQHINKLVLPYRRYAIGPVFRADKPQKGRYRQFTQCDFDVVGSANPIADAEVVAINYTALRWLGFSRFVVEVCDRRLLDGMAQEIGATTREQILAVLRSWDKIEKTPRSQIAEELTAVGAADLVIRFNAVTDKLLQLNPRAPLEELCRLFPRSDAVKTSVQVLEKLVNSLERFGVPLGFYRISPTLARGLDYYTGPIFETVISDAGIGSVTGGGRFDNLIQALGGPSLPATGSSFGLERVVTVMETLGISPGGKTKTQVFVATFDSKSDELTQYAIGLGTMLRENGWKTEVYCGSGSIGAQLRLADRRGIPIAVFAGPDELARDRVIVKNLTQAMSGQGKVAEANQVECSRETLIPTIEKLS